MPLVETSPLEVLNQKHFRNRLRRSVTVTDSRCRKAHSVSLFQVAAGAGGRRHIRLENVGGRRPLNVIALPRVFNGRSVWRNDNDEMAAVAIGCNDIDIWTACS